MMNNKDKDAASKGESQLSYLEKSYTPWLQQDFRDRIFWICDQVVGSNILDVGCGAQVVAALSLAKKGCHVIVIDSDEQAINLARDELRVLPEDLRKRIELSNSDLLTFNPALQFDTIILGNVLQDFAKPEQVLAGLLRFLSPGGTIVVTVPYAVKFGVEGQRRLDLPTFQSIIPDELSLEVLTIADLNIRAVLRRDDKVKRRTAEELLDTASHGLLQAQLYVLRKSDWLEKTIEKRNFLISGYSYKLKFMENRVKRLETKNSKLEKKVAASEAQKRALADKLSSSPVRMTWRLIRLSRKVLAFLGKR